MASRHSKRERGGVREAEEERSRLAFQWTFAEPINAAHRPSRRGGVVNSFLLCEAMRGHFGRMRNGSRNGTAVHMESGGAPADASSSPMVTSASSTSLQTAPTTATALWPAEKSSYIRGDEIGQGATSLVYDATCPIMNGARCALKVINLERCSTAASLDEINKEINAGKKLKHENVVQYYTSFLHETDLYIVMELAPRGSLHDYLKFLCSKRGLSNGALDENAIATILRDALRGLVYIHENNLIHRDIKCGNLLVRADGAIQIADFGVAGAIQNAIDVRHTFVGTPCWMAPEIMMIVLRAQKLWDEMDNRCGSSTQVGYNQKADIWSLGITTLELAIGRAPLAEAQPLKILLTTVTSEPPSLESVESRSKVPVNYTHYGQKFRKFVRCCLIHDPNKRSTSKELLSHPFIKSKAKDRDFLLKTLFTVGEVPPVPVRQQHGRRQHLAIDRISGSNDQPSSGEWDFRIADGSDSSDESISGGIKMNAGAGAHASAPGQQQSSRSNTSPTRTAASNTSAPSASAPSGAAAPAGATPAAHPSPVKTTTTQIETVTAPHSPVPPAAHSTAQLQIVAGPVDQPESGPMTPYLMRLSTNSEVFPLTYKLILRKRFLKKDGSNETELRDVSFLFEPGRDTPETMARDLVEAELLFGTDYVLVAHNIDKIVRRPTKANPHVFQTNSQPHPPHTSSETDLHGFIRVTLKMPSVEEMVNKRAQEEARQQMPQQPPAPQPQPQQPPQQPQPPPAEPQAAAAPSAPQ